VDTNIEVHDGSTGSSNVIGNGGDILKIPVRRDQLLAGRCLSL
jgi:hypothetical protein